jgi:hypothetical protein
MKLKLVTAALALSFAGSAFAALTPAGTTAYSTNTTSGNSSLIFSAWDSTGSYSFDLGYTLTSLVGADNITAVTKASGNLAANNANTLTAPSTITSPPASYDILLTGFAASGFAANGASWNLAAGGTNVRTLFLVSQATTGGQSISNSAVGNAANNLDNYMSLLSNSGPVADSVTATSTDLWYANASGWGSTLGASGISGTAVGYGSAAELFLAYANSSLAGNNLLSAGFADTTYTAFTHYGTGVNASDLYLTIQAVPEADTSGMMIVGLGLMGFIARRRKQVK